MAYVFRIESPDGEGIYTSNIWNDAVYKPFLKGADDVAEGFDNLHPAPQNDPLISHRHPFKNKLFFDEEMKAFSCCFSSVDQLMDWTFSQEWRDSLHKHHAIVVVYKVSKKRVIFGETQAMFETAFATPVGILPINNMGVDPIKNMKKYPK